VSTTSTLENGLVVDFTPLATKVSDEEFADLCRLNPELQFERTSEGELVIMSPTGGRTGARNFKLISQLGVWTAKDLSGIAFDSSTVFTLPNTAKRSPDVAWVRNDRWNALSTQEQEQFPPLCPDFVVELGSRTDSLRALKEKMEEYISNGAVLGWLIDPLERRIHVYRADGTPQVLEDPKELSGEPLLRGFVLDVQVLWD
jgi:Uma2 family endonuclease